jgi:tetratricopeptide (TPR) repeat protein
VLPFVNASGEAETRWLSATLSEMLLRELRVSEAFRWIPETSSYQRALPPLRTLLAQPMYVRWVGPVDIVVSGEYTTSDPSSGKDRDLQLTVSLADRTGARTTTTLSEAGTTTNVRELISRVGAQARSTLGVSALSADQLKALAASQPANAAAARAYALGVMSGPEAVPFMETALAADPMFVQAHIVLAEGWQLRRDHDKAHAAATRAVELSARLPFEERLLIATRAYPISARATPPAGLELAHGTDEVWQQLFERYPDTLLYGLEVAMTQLRARQFEQGLATMGMINLLPGTSENYELRLLESQFAQNARDYPRALLALDRAATAARAASDQSRLGEIHFRRARLSLELGNPADAVSFGQAARQTGSNPLGLRDTLIVALRATGDFSGATTEAKAKIADARTARHSNAEVHARILHALLLFDQGALAEARSVLVQLLRDGSRDFGTGDESKARMALADVLQRRGELAAARNEWDKIAGHHRQRAGLLLVGGDIAGARELADRSLQVLRWDNLGSPSAIAWTLSLRGRIALESGDAGAARRTMDEVAPPLSATRPRRNALEPDRRDEFDVAVIRALVALQAGRWSESRASAQTAIALARGDFRKDDEATGESVLALGWLGDGQAAEARAAIARAEPRWRVTEDQLLRLSGGIAAAHVRAASGKAPDLDRARKDLEALVRQAETLGTVAIGFEARLALGEIEIKAGQVGPGRQRLEALRQDASSRGFNRIATKAAAAAR